MDLLNFKSEEQIIQEGIALLEKTDLNQAGSSGKICRLLINIVSSLVGDAYKTLQLNHLKLFLSTSTGEALDAIGFMLNCSRWYGEIDNDYRYRISQSTLTAATANQTSIKLAAMSVEGVQSVIMKQYTCGSGSFSLYVVSEFSITPESILTNVKSAVEAVTGYGIKSDILSPIIKDVKLELTIAFSPLATEEDRALIVNDVRIKIVGVINTMDVGESLIIKDLISTVTQMNSMIKDAYLSSLRIDDQLVFLTNQECRWNQRFLVSSTDGAITVQGA